MKNLYFGSALTVALCFQSEAFAVNLCGPLLQRFIYYLQRGSLSKMDDPAKAVREEVLRSTGEDVLDRSNPRSVYAFEDDVLDIFSTAPALRSVVLEAFQHKWDLTEEQVLDALTFYGTQVFFKDVGVIGELEATMKRLAEVNRTHFLADGESFELARRYRYYLANLTQLSVPEMAAQLGISEHQVYSDLPRLRLSINAAFLEPLGKRRSFFAHEQLDSLGRPDLKDLINPQVSIAVAAKQLLQSKLSKEEIARVLSIGQQAMDFVFHHRHDSSRGVSWKRLIEFQGDEYPEEALAVLLHNRNWSHQRIADKINEIVGVGRDESDYRSAASVSEKLKDLGELRSQPNLPDFPPLLIVGHFLRNPTQTNAEIAAILGVTPDTVRRVLANHNMVRIEGQAGPNISRSAEAEGMFKRYAEQQKAVDESWEWMKQNDYRWPINKDFGTKDQQIHIRQAKLYGTDNYGPGRDQHHNRLFNSQEDFAMALKARARQEGHEFITVTIPQWGSPITERLRQVWRDETTQMILDWVKKNPGRPVVRDVFGSGDNQIPLKHSKVLGTGDYAPAGPQHNKRIFDSHQDMLIAVKEAALKQGIKFDLVRQKLHMTAPSERFVEYMQQEALHEVYTWIKTNNEGRMPIKDAYFRNRTEAEKDLPKYEQANRIPFAQQRFYGSTQDKRNNFFNSQDEALISLKAYAAARGMKLYLLDFNVRWADAPSNEVREQWKQEATELALDWAEAHGGRMPNHDEWRTAFPNMAINYQKVYGTGAHSSTGRYHAHRIFDSYEQGKAHFIEAAKKRNLTLTWPRLH